ncbi:MAG: PorP/SprF family type IX secretion system membrane protein [Algibacter sp.]
MKKHLLYIILFFSIIQQVYSQEDGVVALSLPVRNSLKFNKYAINPTFSFVREQNKYISFTNKRQWVQFDNAPLTYLVSYSGRLKENIGVGLGLFQQDYGVLSTFGGVVNFAYNAVLNRDSNLTFGMNLSYYQSGLNTGKVITNFSDPSLNDIPSNSIVTVNPGINYGTAFFDFGVSVNNAVSYHLNTSEIIENNPEQSIQGHVMYTGYMNNRGFFDNSKFSGLIRSEFKKEETVISGVMMLTVPKGIWGQVGYNSLYGASAGVGLNISEQIALEYNYEQSIGELSTFGNSHEVTLAYRFKNKERYIYSGDDREEGLLSAKNKKRVAVKRDKAPVTQEDKDAIAETKERARAQAIEKARIKAETRAKLVAEAKAKRDAKIKAFEDKKVTTQDVAKTKVEEQTEVNLIEETQAEEAKVKADELAKIKSAAETKAKAEEQAKIKLAEAAKAKAEELAKIKLAAETKAKAEEQTKIKLAEAAKAKAEELSKIKLAAETKAKVEEQAKIKLAEAAKAKAEELAKIKLAAETKAKAEEQAKIRLAEDAKVKAEELTKIKLAEEIKAKAEEQAKIKLAEDAKAKAEVEAIANLKSESAISIATDDIAQSLISLQKLTEESSIEQRQLLVGLTERVDYKQQTLDELKEENDLSEQGVVIAPKPFKSISAENAALESLKIELDNVIKSQNEKITEFESLYKKRLKKFRDKDDADNLIFDNVIQKLKSDQSQAVNSRDRLISKLATINVATEVERNRRIKRAAYDNEEDRFVKDKAALERIKKFTKPSAEQLSQEDFDFGENQSSDIRIVKDVKNVDSGYYLVVAVHNNVEKRDEFLSKAIAAGQTNINFFYDVTSSKYFIYYEKYDGIGQAQRAMQTKGSEPYNGNMSMVKIEN